MFTFWFIRYGFIELGLFQSSVFIRQSSVLLKGLKINLQNSHAKKLWSWTGNLYFTEITKLLVQTLYYKVFWNSWSNMEHIICCILNATYYINYVIHCTWYIFVYMVPFENIQSVPYQSDVPYGMVYTNPKCAIQIRYWLDLGSEFNL